MAKVDGVNYSVDFDNLYSKMDNFDKCFRTGKVSDNMLKFIPGLVKVSYQGKLRSTEMKRKYADNTYKNKKVIEFNFQLTKGHYTNFQNAHLCFPLEIKSAVDNDHDITVVFIIVNKFFSHLIKEIDIKRYSDNVLILPLTNTVNVYQYSDKILKHIQKDALKNTKRQFLQQNEGCYLQHK